MEDRSTGLHARHGLPAAASAEDSAADVHLLQAGQHPDQADHLPDLTGQPAAHHPLAAAEESADLPDAAAAECPAAAVQEDAADSYQKNNKEQCFLYCSFYVIPFEFRFLFSQPCSDIDWNFFFFNSQCNRQFTKK